MRFYSLFFGLAAALAGTTLGAVASAVGPGPRAVYDMADDPVIVSGRIVHGITRQPLPGALATIPTRAMGTMDGSIPSLAYLDRSNWQLLHGVPGDAPADHKDLRRALGRACFLGAFARAGPDGRFQLAWPPTPRDERRFGGQFWLIERTWLLFLGEDSLPVRFGFRRDLGAEELRGRVDVGDVPLFPAAKVMVRPLAPAGYMEPARDTYFAAVKSGDLVEIHPEWVIDQEKQPPWVAPLLKREDRGQTDPYWYIVHYACPLRNNERQPVLVPAGVNLKLEFRPRELPVWAGVPAKWRPVWKERVFELKQGEVAESGDVRFEHSPEPRNQIGR